MYIYIYILCVYVGWSGSCSHGRVSVWARFARSQVSSENTSDVKTWLTQTMKALTKPKPAQASPTVHGSPTEVREQTRPFTAPVANNTTNDINTYIIICLKHHHHNNNVMIVILSNP